MSEMLTSAQEYLNITNQWLSDEARTDAHDSALHDFLSEGRREMSTAAYRRYADRSYWWLRAYEANLARFVECESS